jgi:DNA-binding NarL/FixJ family response regulator
LDERHTPVKERFADHASAWQYLTKDSSKPQLQALISDALDGDTDDGRDDSGEKVRFDAQHDSAAAADWDRLTPRQQEVLSLLAEGLDVAECAKLLKTSPKTIENHKFAAMRKLKIHRHVKLVLWAIRHRRASASIRD